MKKRIPWICLLCLLGATVALADEGVRQVQEELRKRNLYFGDIDGQTTADLANSLKRYQARKGFPATGVIDTVTTASLNIQLRSAESAHAPPLPDTPILKSDRAPLIPPAERVALEKAAEENPDDIPMPPPPAEAPPATQELSLEKVTRLVQDYLRACETNDIRAQTEKYFAYPVKYFSDGLQGPAFVERDVEYYLRRWPKRRYTLVEPIVFAASPHEGETNIQFKISFELQNNSRRAAGRTNNFWTIRAEDGELKILSIQEERLRE